MLQLPGLSTWYHQEGAAHKSNSVMQQQPSMDSVPGPAASQSPSLCATLPQKEMMWLLSSCTNFLVTASSMICFTC